MHSCELDSSPLQGVLDTTLCREVCQKVYGFLMVLVSWANKTDRHGITEIVFCI